MIIFSGCGFLVGVIGFGSFLVTEVVSERMTQNSDYYQQTPQMIFVAGAIAAVLTIGLNKLLSLKKKRVVIDKETGEEFELGGNHSFFFIPVKWWSYLFFILGVVFMLMKEHSLNSPSPEPSQEAGMEHI